MGTDRKHEAIEIIARWIQAGDSPDKYSLDEAEALYDRVAPLMPWEFPDAKMRELLRDTHLSEEGLFWKIKCLCEGQEPREGDKLWLDQSGNPLETLESEGDFILEQPKGTCQKCGGNKQIHRVKSLNDYYDGSPYWGDCPDCDGTGECQHKNVVEVEDDFPTRIYCDDCQQYLKSRRSGEERRQYLGGFGRRKSMGRRGREPQRPSFDRRRSPDRRKAVSDEDQKARITPQVRR